MKLTVLDTGRTESLIDSDEAAAFVGKFASAEGGVIVVVTKGEHPVRSERRETMTIGVNGDWGFAIWHPAATAIGIPDMSTRGAQQDADRMSFRCETNEVVFMPGEYLVPRSDIAEIVRYFAATGGMAREVTWEAE